MEAPARTDPWVARTAVAIAGRFAGDLEALVAVSSPSGDVPGAEAAVGVATGLLPAEAGVERPECSSPGHAPDMLARLAGTGSGRVLLLGHLDTVVAHPAHRPLVARDGRLEGSGAADMKGGVVLALGALRALAARRDAFAEIALLLVVDEEWRTRPFHHGPSFAGWDACLCFEAGERGARDGEEGVVVKRKAAGTLRVTGHGAASHSGSAPDKGRNALLALTAAAAAVAEQHDPAGADHLTAVPTILRSGEAFNVVPAAGELFCDLRADSSEVFSRVLDAVPPEVGGATLRSELIRVWPGMDARATTSDLLSSASDRLGRPVVAMERGGASDASHIAAVVPLTVDGLGPRGGGAHTPEEFVRIDAVEQRAGVALAVLDAALA